MIVITHDSGFLEPTELIWTEKGWSAFKIKPKLFLNVLEAKIFIQETFKGWDSKRDGKLILKTWIEPLPAESLKEEWKNL